MTTGFASPTDDFLEGKLSLDNLIVPNKESTFFVRADGDAMFDACISQGDLLVVDKSIKPISGHIVIANFEGELIVRRYIQHDGRVTLKADNPTYDDIAFKEGNELKIGGVVTALIKQFT